MADRPGSQRVIRQFAVPLTILGTVLGLALLLCGLYYLFFVDREKTNAILMFGPGLVVSLLSLYLYALIEFQSRAQEGIEKLARHSDHMLEALDRMEAQLKSVAHNSRLSDAAKSIAHRDTEVEALRLAIRDEIARGDSEAAEYLINEMERRFGYSKEAHKLREEMAHTREMTIEEKISQALAHIEKLIDDHQWQRAAKESDRLKKIFPRHDRVLALPELIRMRRDARKQELLREWATAVERNEIDRGIAILTELDQYLTPQEAQSLAESAKHVFKARLLNLGVQFGLAVSETQWRDALEIGLRIIKEFPSSRMAQEVREKIDTLRMRAGYGQDAVVIDRRESRTPPPLSDSTDGG